MQYLFSNKTTQIYHRRMLKPKAKDKRRRKLPRKKKNKPSFMFGLF